MTAWEAGYVGGHGPKSGAGFQLVTLINARGMPLAWEVGPLQRSEHTAAAAVVDAFEREVSPHLGRDVLPEAIPIHRGRAGDRSRR